MKYVVLSYLKTGQSAIITSIDKDCSCCKRLLELGLVKGTKVTMVKNNAGPVIINVSSTKLALGKCLSNNIIVQLI